MSNELNLSKEDIRFLKDLKEELTMQDYNYQAQPAFWVVGDYRWVSAYEGTGEREVLYIQALNEEGSMNYDEVAQEIIEYYDENFDVFGDESDYIEHDEDKLEFKRNYHRDEYSDSDIFDMLDLMDIEYTLYEETREHFIVKDTLFLTQKEAINHIESNRHHYTKDVHPYTMTAWRSPEFEQLLKILTKL